ncbi:MAG: hypothetical protein H0T79_15800 [Deltaproteobacteria bacterium]|nr:hypothetical protein [Deltaproteobacteria bacterium]
MRSSIFGTTLATVTLVGILAMSGRADAQTDCRCLSVAADVAASISVDVMRADGLYARGDFAGALALYAKAYGISKDGVLLYAQGMANISLGARAEAKAFLEAYLKVGGNLAFRAQAEANLRQLDAGVVGGVVGGVGGVVGGITGGVRGGVSGGVGVVGGVTAPVKKKVAGTAALVLGVVAIAAVGAVGIHMIAAGLKDDISLDAKFDLGLGLTGVTVGITAIYLSGLTVAAGAVGASCVSTLPKHTPIVAPVAMPGGGGLAAALTF